MTFTSLGRFQRKDRIAVLEAVICCVSPALAFVLRGVELNNPPQILPVFLYWGSSIVGGLLAVFYIQISKLPVGFISSVDLIKIFKAAMAASVAGVIGTYFGTQLQFVPRFVPVIHFFIFSGLMTVVSIWRSRSIDKAMSIDWPVVQSHSTTEHQVLVGCTPLAVHYASLIDGLTSSHKAIAGIVSIESDFVGKTMAGRTVLGPISNISEILTEFKNHGIEIHRIVISTVEAQDQKNAFDMLSVLCAENGIALSFLSDLLIDVPPDHGSVQKFGASALIKAMSQSARVVASPTRYLIARQRYEWFVALVLAVLVSPLLIVIGSLTYFDVGRPVIFWQKRVGRFGQMTTVHKYRTLPHSNASINGERHPSWFGRFLQKTRLDEMPQIFDILEGRLSFIGPRPLLPYDLPKDTGIREAVLPGITGWAQVHGGKHVSPEEKIALDDWYLRHATFVLDMVILLKTMRVMLRGYEKRDDAAIELAVDEFKARPMHAANVSAQTNSADHASATRDDTSAHDLIRSPNVA